MGLDSTLDKEKYANAVLYIVKYCNNSYLGATKLNKLIYYLDFVFYRDNKRSVTGDVYVHKQYGPVPARIDDMITELRQSERLKVTEEEYKDGGVFSYEALVDPVMSVFDDKEIALLEDICKEFSAWSTDKIVNQTHLEAPWFHSKPFESVNYEYSNDIDFFE